MEEYIMSADFSKCWFNTWEIEGYIKSRPWRDCWGNHQPNFNCFFRNSCGKLFPMNDAVKDVMSSHAREILSRHPQVQLSEFLARLEDSNNYISLRDGILEWKRQCFEEYKKSLEQEECYIKHALKYGYDKVLELPIEDQESIDFTEGSVLLEDGKFSTTFRDHNGDIFIISGDTELPLSIKEEFLSTYNGLGSAQYSENSEKPEDDQR